MPGKLPTTVGPATPTTVLATPAGVIFRMVVNVGAGAGAYEPRDHFVVAIEPSEVMVAQRSREQAPALRALAHRLPLRQPWSGSALCIGRRQA